MSSVLAWHAFFSVLIICFGGSSSSGTAANQDSTVSQMNQLVVHDDGRVEVETSIAFHQTSNLPNIYKLRILPISSGQMLDNSSLSVNDENGHDLQFVHTIKNDWYEVDVDILQSMGSIPTDEYVVHLKYTLVQGFCRTTSGQLRLEIGWTHPWLTQVNISRYEISFADQNKGSVLETVCFLRHPGLSSCGRHGLDFNGKQAGTETKGEPDDAYFTWVDGSTRGSARPCEAGQKDVVNNKKEEKSFSTILKVLIAASIAGAVLAIACCCMYKMTCCACALLQGRNRKPMAPTKIINSSTSRPQKGDTKLSNAIGPNGKAGVQPDLEKGVVPSVVGTEEERRIKKNVAPSSKKSRPLPGDDRLPAILAQHTDTTAVRTSNAQIPNLQPHLGTEGSDMKQAAINAEASGDLRLAYQCPPADMQERIPNQQTTQQADEDLQLASQASSSNPVSRPNFAPPARDHQQREKEEDKHMLAALGNESTPAVSKDEASQAVVGNSALVKEKSNHCDSMVQDRPTETIASPEKDAINVATLG